MQRRDGRLRGGGCGTGSQGRQAAVVCAGGACSGQALMERRALEVHSACACGDMMTLRRRSACALPTPCGFAETPKCPCPKEWWAHEMKMPCTPASSPTPPPTPPTAAAEHCAPLCEHTAPGPSCSRSKRSHAPPPARAAQLSTQAPTTHIHPCPCCFAPHRHPPQHAAVPTPTQTHHRTEPIRHHRLLRPPALQQPHAHTLPLVLPQLPAAAVWMSMPGSPWHPQRCTGPPEDRTHAQPANQRAHCDGWQWQPAAPSTCPALWSDPERWISLPAAVCGAAASHSCTQKRASDACARHCRAQLTTHGLGWSIPLATVHTPRAPAAARHRSEAAP